MNNAPSFNRPLQRDTPPASRRRAPELARWAPQIFGVTMSQYIKLMAAAAMTLFITGTSFANDLFDTLNTPQTSWSMNHICTIDELVLDKGFTNKDFVDAILQFAKVRWNRSRDALKNNDKDNADFLLGYLSHTIIDLHWPGRIIRNQEGLIVGFKKCSDFGGGQALLQQESNPSPEVQNDSAFRQTAKEAVTYLFEKYKSGSQFEEVEERLRNGILRLAPGYEDKLLGN